MDPYIFCDSHWDMMPLFIASEFLNFVIIGVYISMLYIWWHFTFGVSQ